jgi:diacylglycerol kinase family enzyme
MIVSLMKDEKEVILICNPKAGGRWKELADILDSDQATHARRIVTDEISDIKPALAALGKSVRLLCFYGGDGTYQKILSEILKAESFENINCAYAFIGGGTMNVTSRWAGWNGSPGSNFRKVINSFMIGKLKTRDVRLMKITQGGNVNYGFTFGTGTVIRILNRYEESSKGKIEAIALLVKTLLAIWTNFPRDWVDMLEQMEAEIFLDGKRLQERAFVVSFCNVTGEIVYGVSPYKREKDKDSFYFLAYSINKKETALLLPFIASGKRPIDRAFFKQPVSEWLRIGLSFLADGSFPFDPRYVNTTGREAEIRSREPFYTIDGEIIKSTGEPIKITMGPVIKIAIP